MSEQSNISTVKKLSIGTKLAYAAGDFGCNFSWQYVSSFLLIFYTDVFGVTAGAVSVLFLICRIWDAINDPIVGALADRTKTRWGRYRPWVMFGTVPLALMTVVVFWARPEWSGTAKTVYMYITYGILVLAYTCVNLPYGTMAGVMTQDTDQRSHLTSLRMCGAQIAIGILNFAGPLLVNVFGNNGANPGNGYLGTTALFSAFLIIGLMITAFKCREIVMPTDDERKEKVPVSKMLKDSFKNSEFVKTVAMQAIMGFTFYGRTAIFMYYFTYYANNLALMSVFSAVGIIPGVLGTLAFDLLYRWIGSKGRVGALANLVAGICLVVMFFVNPVNNTVLFMVIHAIYQFVNGINASAMYGVIPDTVEYGEWKTGKRYDGFQYAFISFANKFGITISTALIALVLQLIGYVPNAVQNANCLFWINSFMTWVPGILLLVNMFIFFRMKVTRESFSHMLNDIYERKNAAKAEKAASNE